MNPSAISPAGAERLLEIPAVCRTAVAARLLENPVFAHLTFLTILVTLIINKTPRPRSLVGCNGVARPKYIRGTFWTPPGLPHTKIPGRVHANDGTACMDVGRY